MTDDDFESELRESLGKAVPAPPETHSWAAGARAYTHRVRRTRAIITVGAAAAVVAAIVVVPSVLASGDGDNNTGPAVKTPQTLPTLTMPPVAHPFTCPEKLVIHDEASPPNGVVPSGAVLARLCAVDTAGSNWSAPAEPLVTDLDGLVRALDAMPKVPRGAFYHCPTEFLYQPQYSLSFQYPDGHTTSVTGRTGGCGLITAGRVARRGAEALLRDYLARLHDQRARFTPPQTQITPLMCPTDPQAKQTVLVDGRGPGLTSAIACSYSLGARAPSGRGMLSDSQVAQLNADLAAHATHRGAPASCSQSFTLGIVGVDAWGDQVELVDRCSVFSFTDREGTWYWTPSQQTSAMLDSAQEVATGDGRISGRLMVIGGLLGSPPRPLSGLVRLRGAGGTFALPVPHDGRFTKALPPGRYRILGQSPSFGNGGPCSRANSFVTIRAHHTTRIWVVCEER